jgi:hypothetical protein
VAVPAPTIQGTVLVPTQTTVTVTNVISTAATKATKVSVYANDTTLIGSVTTTGFTGTTVTVPVTALVNAQLISARQTIAGVEGPASAIVTVAVPAPTVPNALGPGDGIVQVTNLHPLASTVRVFVNNVLVGTASTAGAATVNVPITPDLQADNVVKATQVIGGVEGPASEEITIASGYCDVVFESNMDSATGWTTFIPGADASATFGFDYSTMGIPASPHGGGTTRGLRMVVNESSGVRETLAATPTGLNMTGQFQVRFDFWINANGPFPAGGAGSTLFLGGGVGFTNVQPVSAAAGPGSTGGYLVISGEGGANRDWRMYKNAVELTVTAPNPYDVANNEVPAGTELAAAFPSKTPPQFQRDNYAQQTGSTNAGAGGFAWHTMVITVDTAVGKANFTVDGFSIGTVDTNVGTAVTLSGAVQLLYSDIFTSITNNTALSFGVVDNFMVLRNLASPGTDGDWENDGDVDLVDYTRFSDCFAGPGATANPKSGPGCRRVCDSVFDDDADGDVDLRDFGAFLNAFGQ